jgi:hypothetical protein
MTRGLIAPIPKDGDREYLLNWRPITLLNSSYKIFAKALPLCLQVLLLNIVHDDQLAFFLLCFFWNNILIQHETIAWTHESQQDLLLLKLDFTKAYKWSLGDSCFGQFVDMVRLLFSQCPSLGLVQRSTYKLI